MNTIAVQMAEQSVVGCILAEPVAVLPYAVGCLDVEDFALKECGEIFAVCKSRFLAGRPIDILTVFQQLGGGTEIKEYITKLVETAPNPLHYAEYVDLVADAAKRRRAAFLATRLVEQLGEDSLTDCLSTSTELSQALADTKRDSCVSPEDGFMAVYTAAVSDKPHEYIRTGFATLDKYTFISKGDFIIVGGRPSAGKTAFTLQTMLNIAQAYRVVYFSLETNPRKIYDRLVSCYSETSFRAIKAGGMEDATRMAAHYKPFSELKFTVAAAAGWTVEQIKAKAVQFQADVIFIDYLSLIRAEGRSQYEKVTNISIALHTMAQNSNITVIALSQLNRDGDPTRSKSPELVNLRESGQAEQDADIVLFIYEDAVTKGEDGEDDKNADRILKIAKNKEGNTGAMRLSFAGDIQKFYEQESRYR